MSKLAQLHTERAKAQGVADIADNIKNLQSDSNEGVASMIDKQGFNNADAIRTGFANLLEHLEAAPLDEDTLLRQYVLIGWAQEHGRQLRLEGKDYNGNPLEDTK
jgi:hypothetical protein